MPKSKRPGADAAFAKAMARSEFGRFYCDDDDIREIRRCMARGQARRQADRSQDAAIRPPQAGAQPQKAQSEKKTPPRQPLWRPVGVRERRTELKAGIARLKREHG